MDVYLHLIVVNLLLVAVALLVPLAHRISDIAGALLIAIAEFAALFYFVRALGHDSGIQTNYIIAAAVAFAICGMTRFRLTVAVILARARAASCRLVPLSAGTRADRRSSLRCSPISTSPPLSPPSA